MADARTSILRTIDLFEDVGRTGKITEDDGGRTRFGIAEVFNPDMPEGFFDGSMPKDEALDAAIGRYHDRYWKPLFDNIKSQVVADKVFDMTVNPGKMKLIQHAINNCGEVVVEDGRFGPICLNALNRVADHDILPELRRVQEEYYRAKVAEAPYKQKWLGGWLRRAKA